LARATPGNSTGRPPSKEPTASSRRSWRAGGGRSPSWPLAGAATPASWPALPGCGAKRPCRSSGLRPECRSARPKGPSPWSIIRLRAKTNAKPQAPSNHAPSSNSNLRLTLSRFTFSSHEALTGVSGVPQKHDILTNRHLLESGGFRHGHGLEGHCERITQPRGKDACCSAWRGFIGVGVCGRWSFIDLKFSSATVAHGTYFRRKKPTPFVMNRYCELVTPDGLNNPPFQFPHVPPRSGLN